MAEGEGDRRFDPTAKRRREFREQGRVAVSRDLAGAAQLAGVIVAFLVVGNALLSGLSASLVWVLSHVGDDAAKGLDLGEVLRQHLDALLMPTVILSAILIAATALAYLVQTGFLFNFSAVAPNFARVNPLARLGELFSPKNFFVRSGLTLAKLGLAAFAVSLALASRMHAIQELGVGTIQGTAATLGNTLQGLLVTTVALLAVVAAIDYLWQRGKLMAEMRMTKEEIKKETEEEEGKPQIKQARRQKHRELSMNRIVKEVPRADVVLTNPTHVAVALRYRAGKDKAPVVVAKGAEELALVVRRIARQHGVPIIEHRALARALYTTVKVGRPIPSNFFQAVAQVLARVYRARREAGLSR